jgi:hypothetical protein
MLFQVCCDFIQLPGGKPMHGLPAEKKSHQFLSNSSGARKVGKIWVKSVLFCEPIFLIQRCFQASSFTYLVNQESIL